jgi:hypothetical protein
VLLAGNRSHPGTEFATLPDARRSGNLALPTEASGSSSAVERQLPKLDVAGSIPVSRSIFPNYKTASFAEVGGCVASLGS